MITAGTVIAKKYATAYLNLYGDNFAAQDKDGVEHLQVFFGIHKQVLIMLALPASSKELLWKNLQQLLAYYNITESLTHLVKLVVMEGRALLLPEVLKQLLVLFYKRNHLMRCTILTSHSIDKESCEIIRHFMSRLTSWDVIYEHKVDPSLIAGIRVVSDTAVWEYSIQQQLRNISLVLIR